MNENFDNDGNGLYYCKDLNKYDFCKCPKCVVSAECERDVAAYCKNYHAARFELTDVDELEAIEERKYPIVTCPAADQSFDNYFECIDFAGGMVDEYYDARSDNWYELVCIGPTGDLYIAVDTRYSYHEPYIFYRTLVSGLDGNRSVLEYWHQLVS